ncbi:MAG: hypothetical protein RMM29_07010 [Planctomycetota bacterium]|nr:hypothetical protein [Planctomycetota bacterium]MCX8039685.1 hypothetical protein [Planctomycetota bacterium]MDW8373379.1 hypothetical protein [Planctomycetota bacterium]
MSAILVLGPECADDPEWPQLAARFAQRGVHTAIATALTPGALLAAAAGHAPAWLATRDARAVSAAQTAGYEGLVIIGDDAASAATVPPSLLTIRSCRRLADVGIALVPRGGGCWHDRR